MIFYFPVSFILQDERKEFASSSLENGFVSITIPDNCPKCNNKFRIIKPGSTDSETSLYDYCHLNTYAKIFSSRMKLVHDQVNDGCKCNQCASWVPMAAPNLPDNKFKCYSCRTHPLSI
jgi:hypothetical protein